MVDASMRARTLAVSQKPRPPSNGQAQNLPMRILAIAQGESGKSFSTTKFRAYSRAEVGNVAGYRSAAYQAAREFWPDNGDGVGNVPVEFCLLEDAAGASAATGQVTVSGTATRQDTFRARVGRILCQEFAVPAGAVNQSLVLRRLKESIENTLGVPAFLTYTYGTVTSTATRVGSSNGTLGTFVTTGAPKPGNWVLTCTALVANGGTFKLVDPDGIEVSTTISVGTAQLAGGLGFTLTDGTTDFAVGDKFDITVPVTAVAVTSGWKGVTANDIQIEIEGPNPGIGVDFAITQLTGGTLEPSITNALAQLGSKWTPFILNGLSITNATALDALVDASESRWNETVRKPFAALVGAKATTVTQAIAVPDGRKNDRVNVQIPTVGSKNLPIAAAARALTRVVQIANKSPSKDYCLQRLETITPGADADQWDANKRDAAIKGGSSTLEVVNDVLRLSNVVTFYHPTAEDIAWSNLVTLVKNWQVLYNVDLIFASEDYAGGALVPDDQAVDEPTAIKPKMAVADVADLFLKLGRKAIIADPQAAIATLRASIGGGGANPNFLRVEGHYQISGNNHVTDVPFTWSFYVGG